MKKLNAQTAVRKPLLVFAGAALVVLLAGFGLMKVVGGDSSEPESPPVKAPQSVTTAPGRGETRNVAAGLRPGGRDPFKPLIVQGSTTAAQPKPAPAAPASSQASASTDKTAIVEAVSVGNGVATVKVDSKLHENVKPGARLSQGYVLEVIQGACVFVAHAPERFRVCEGERIQK